MPPLVAIATCRVLPEEDVDAELLLAALRGAGLEVDLLPWDGGEPEDEALLARADKVVIRSTWNYHARPDDFLAWVERVGERLLNPPAIVRGNLHKRYLEGLAARGLPTVPTLFIDRRRPVAELLARVAERGLGDLVVKPAVSAGSYATRRFADGRIDAAWAAALLAERDLMVQPYVASVDGYGERAVVAIDGEITHAVRKSPRFADGAEAVSPALPVADDERALAERALAAVGERLLYARVDLVRDAAGAPMLGELELIEPSLFLRQHPPALERFVSALRRRLG